MKAQTGHSMIDKETALQLAREAGLEALLADGVVHEAEIEALAQAICSHVRQVPVRGDAGGSSNVIHQGSATGVIEFMRSERKPGEQECKCCPGESGHIFFRGVKFGEFHDVYPEHFGHGVRELLGSVALFNNTFEGKRVRVTVEVLED